MSHVLLPYIHGNQSGPELGPPRLRQVRLQEGERFLAAWLGTLYLPSASLLYGLSLQGCREGLGSPWSTLPRQHWFSHAHSLAALLAALCPDPPGAAVHACSAGQDAFSTGDYSIGWGSAAQNCSETWAYSAPDLLG